MSSSLPSTLSRPPYVFVIFFSTNSPSAGSGAASGWLGCRPAQRARRQQPAVAEARLAVDHADFDVALKRVVLQSVIAQHHAAGGTGREQGPRRRDAIRAYPDFATAAAREQDRLVPAG